MKNSDLLYLSVAAALQAYILCPASLDVLATLGTTASFSSLLRPGFTISQLCFTNYLPCFIAITFVSYILTILYILSLVLTITIYAMPPSPLRPIKGVRGIYPLTTVILKQVGYIMLYTLGIFCAQAPARPFLKVTTPLKEDKENHRS